ncbi:MAG TPA: DUF1800 domain-containing protein [Candidatus Acidoferrales bacterium]|nr:DUF1800 domain-containing protein [Candidatus Acidoferrales bacterium]
MLFLPFWLRATPPASAGKTPTEAWKGRLPITDLTEDEAITHALNRLGYGPRPGDLERIRQTGLETWIGRQLHPESINDAPAAARLAGYRTLAMSSAALIGEYQRPEVAAKKLGITVEEYNKRVQEELHPPQGVRPSLDLRPQVILNELMQSKLVRAVYSDRQLEEQLTDFWFNHFNVFVYKDGQEIYLLGDYERSAIRPHVLGKFRDLLEATARSPAMLDYLDNSVSADPDAFDRIKHATSKDRAAWKGLPPVGGKRGLNENYGRELMELHTLGVDGGYSQQDVIAVAKCFTGWTIRDPQKNPEFFFDPRIHDPGEKRVLGKKIHAGGMKDGEQVLDLLVKNRATAHHISYQLAEHFVSDNPPPALVARMQKSFEKSKGDLREVMRTMIYSPEFWSRAADGAKIKTPFEFVASAARALGADVDSPVQMINWVNRIGQPLYQCQPPTGYKDDAITWVNTGALLNRLNFALALATNKVSGAQVDLPSRLGTDLGDDADVALTRAVDTFLGGQLSPQSRDTIEQRATDPQVVHAKLDDPVRHIDLGVVSGLVLGTPEFQRR